MTLLRHPAASIVRAVADAAARWRDADFPPRVRLLDPIAERTGYSLPVIEYALDRLFESLDERSIRATIADELGSVDALDGFVQRGRGVRARALPIGTICAIASRTTIGVALVPAIFALCAKCTVLVKDREDALAAAFFQTLAGELDDLGDAARAQQWRGESDAVDLAAFDGIVAFGDDDTLARIGQRARWDARTIFYGSRASAGYIARDALADERSAARLAAAAARDLVLYESEGCLSLHVLFVEDGGAIAPPRFAETLAAAIERAAVEFPTARIDAASHASRAQARNLAAFRAAGGSGQAFSDQTASFLLALDPPFEQPPAFLPRCLGLYTVEGPDAAAAYLARHRLPIEAFAVAGGRDDVRALALAAGASRIAPLGDLQSPRLGGFHGGRPRIAEFVRWVTDET